MVGTPCIQLIDVKSDLLDRLFFFLYDAVKRKWSGKMQRNDLCCYSNLIQGPRISKYEIDGSLNVASKEIVPSDMIK